MCLTALFLQRNDMSVGERRAAADDRPFVVVRIGAVQPHQTLVGTFVVFIDFVVEIDIQRI
jgi:hypothetical protein